MCSRYIFFFSRRLVVLAVQCWQFFFIYWRVILFSSSTTLSRAKRWCERLLALSKVVVFCPWYDGLLALSSGTHILESGLFVYAPNSMAQE